MLKVIPSKLQIINVEKFVIEHLNFTVVNGHDNIGSIGSIGTQNVNGGIDISELYQGIQDRMEGKTTEAAIYADAIEASAVKKTG